MGPPPQLFSPTQHTNPMNPFTEPHPPSPPCPEPSHKPTQTIVKKRTLNPAHEETHEEPFNPKHAKIRILITRPPSQEFSTPSPNKTSQSFLMGQTGQKLESTCDQNPPASLKRKTSYCIASPLIADQVFQLVLHVLLKLLRQQHTTLHRIVDVEPVIFLLRT